MSGFAVFDRTPPQADGSNGVRPAKRLVKRRVERQTAGDALAFARRRDLGRGGGPNSRRRDRRRDADLEADVVGVLALTINLTSNSTPALAYMLRGRTCRPM